METAFAWLGQIFEAILQLVPRRVIVRATEGGVKWSLWREPIEMKPGIRIYWPLISDIQVGNVARDSFNTPTQPLQTRDGKEVLAGGVVVYHINDVIQAWGKQNVDPANTAQDITQAVIATVISRHSHKYILEHMCDKIEEEITAKARKQLRQFGVYVSRAGLAAFSTTRCLHISGVEIANYGAQEAV
jgi:regulator of protease activity HflC (stomatin/prohibitin superfamily)